MLSCKSKKKSDHWRQQENVRLVDWKCWHTFEKLKVLHHRLIHKWMRRWTMLLRGVVQNNFSWLPKPAWSSSASDGTTDTRCWKIHCVRCVCIFGDDNVNPTTNLLESTAEKRTNDAKFKKKTTRKRKGSEAINSARFLIIQQEKTDKKRGRTYKSDIAVTDDGGGSVKHPAAKNVISGLTDHLRRTNARCKYNNSKM